MFFDQNPKDFEPLEKEQLDEMLAIWEEEIFGVRNAGTSAGGEAANQEAA